MTANLPQRYWTEYLTRLEQKGVDEAISSVFYKNGPLNRWLRRTLLDTNNPHALLSDPVFECLFPWESSTKTLKRLKEEGLLSAETLRLLDQEVNGFPPSRKPYKLQEEAFRCLLNRERCNSLIVSSGTGSGKTECFMVPLIEDLVREYESGKKYQKGIRALILYPLNALSDSQRERLSSWLHACDPAKPIRYVSYNGNTPHTLSKQDAETKALNQPEEVFDRATMRKVIPQIMLSNPSMLERMLLNPKDAGMVSHTRKAKSFRWIILDEAHTYLGSNAANLALLLRRTINAFGVDPKDIHFVAMSATVNAADEDAREQLKKFVMDVSGTTADRVHLVLGHRQLPTDAVETDGLTDTFTLDELETLSEDERYAALRESRTAMSLRNLFLQKGSDSYARLSEIQKALGLTREAALRWIDLLTSITADPKSKRNVLLSLRLHQFLNTTGTIGACVDPNCPHRDSELQNDEWHFGQVWLDERDRCTCGAPVLPLAACSSCNTVALKGTYISSNDGESITLPDEVRSDEEVWSTVADTGMPDISQDIHKVENPDAPEVEEKIEDEPGHQDDEANETVEDNEATEESFEFRMPVLITNHKNEATQAVGISFVRGDNEVRDVTLHYIEEDVESHQVVCPNCQEKKRWDQFFLRRISSRYMQWLMPFVIEHAATSSHDASLPKHGQKLITFTDSRQGTAKMGALLEREGQRSLTVTETYRQLAGLEGATLLPAKRQMYEEVLADPTSDPDEKIFARNKLKKSNQAISWEAMVESISKALPKENNFNHLRQAFLDLYETPDERAKAEQLEGIGKKIATTLLLREFLYRPKNGTTLETCGLVSVVYQNLDQLEQHNVPHEWPSALGLEGWKDYLKLFIDIQIRGRFAVELPDDWYRVGGNIRIAGKRYLSPYAKDEKSTNRRIRWPYVPKNTERAADFVKYTGKLLGLDLEAAITEEDRLRIESLLRTVFDQLKLVNILIPGPSEGDGYNMKPEVMSFKLNTKAYAFEASNKLYDLVIFDKARGLASAICPMNSHWQGATVVELPKVPFDKHQWQDSYKDAREAVRETLSHSEVFRHLMNEGYWHRYGTMALECTGYFSAAEHTAQLKKDTRKDYVKDFKAGVINVLSCSTTMEMGVDLDAINTVVMTTVPPYPANYMQRAGRAGRRGETRSNTLTVANATPRDQEVFQNPTWALEGAKPTLRVALDSRRIVQRHVNAQLLSEFFKDIELSDSEALTLKEWYSDRGLAFSAWLETIVDRSHARFSEIEDKVKRVTRFSVLHHESLGELAENAEAEMATRIEQWKKEAFCFRDLRNAAKEDIAKKAIEKQLKRLEETKIYEGLANSLYLPSSIQITNTTPFNYQTLKEEAAGKPKFKKDNANPMDAYDLPSRPGHIGVHEYAPGMRVVINHGVYESGGLTLNWQSPAGLDGVKEIQQIKVLLRCNQCRQTFMTSQAVTSHVCPNCGSDDVPPQKAILPAGFCVSANYKPNNDYSMLKAYERLEDVVYIEGQAHPVGTSGLLSMKSSTMAQLLAMNNGHGNGFAVCLNCGWAKAEPKNQDVIDEDYFRHQPLRYSLRGIDETGYCSGGQDNHSYQLQRGVCLVSERFTDALELVFTDGYRIFQDDLKRLKSAGYGIGIALRRAIADYLGIEEDEIGITVDLERSKASKALIVQLYDQNMGGYTSGLENIVPALLRRAYEVLQCKHQCSTVCSFCLLTFDTRYRIKDLDRHDALLVLNQDFLKALAIPEAFKHVAGANTDYLSVSLKDCVRYLAAQGNKIQFVVPEKPVEEESLLHSELFGAIEEALVGWNKVEVVAVGFNWQDLAPEQQSELNYLSRKQVLFSYIDKLAMGEGIDDAKVVALLETNDLKQAIVRTSCSVWNPGKDNETLFKGEIRRLLETEEAEGPQSLMSFATPAQRDAVVTDKDFNFVNLTVQNFGERVLLAVARRLNPKITGLEAFFSGKTIKSVSYSDRYLRRHIDLPLVLSLYKALITHSQVDESVALTIKTTEIPEENHRYSYGFKDNFESNESRFNIFRDMRAQAFHDEACKMTFSLEEVPSNRDLGHARQCLINFTDGSVFAIMFDQGVGFAMPTAHFPVGKTDTVKAKTLYQLLKPEAPYDLTKLRVVMVQISGTWLE